MYFKHIEDNIISGIGKSEMILECFTEITKEEYENILSVIESKPEDTETTIYKLHADTLEYVGYDRPEEPTPIETDPEIDSIISEVASNGYN